MAKETYSPFLKDELPKRVTMDDEMSWGAHRLYTILVHYANWVTGECFPSQTTLAKRMNLKDRHSVSPYVTELVERGHITTQFVRIKNINGELKGRPTYLYTLTIPSATVEKNNKMHSNVKWQKGYQPIDY